MTLRLLNTSCDPLSLSRLHVSLPAAYVAKKHTSGTIFVRTDPGGIGEPGLLQVTPSATHLDIEKFNTGTGFNGVTDVIGQFWMEVGSGSGGGSGGGGGPGGGPIPPGGPGPGPIGTPPIGLPDESALIQSLAAANPIAIQESCISAGGNWVFMDLAVAALQATDARWGYNGKRGDITDPSTDAVSYYWGTGSPVDGSNEVYVVDIVASQCPPSAATDWNFADVTCYDGSCLGAYIASRP